MSQREHIDASASPLQVRVFGRILNERVNQEHLRASGKFDFTAASKVLKPEFKLPILMEEVGELSKEINEKTHILDNSKLRNELVQVCAVAFAWLESLE